MAQLQGGSSGAAPVAPTTVSDPLEELKRLLQQNGVGQNVGSSQDYYAQAQSIYAPQFGYLDQMTKDANERAKAAQGQAGQLYGALSKEILGQEGGIKQNYQTAIKGTDSAYQQALQNYTGQVAKSRNSSAEILQRLGIQEAAPNVMGEYNDNEKLLAGIMRANGLASSNQLRQGEQSAVTYNRAQGNAAKLAGGEAQTGIGRQLSDFLNQIGMKRAELGTQVGSAAASMQSDAAKAAQQNGWDTWDRMFKISEAERDAAEFAMRNAATAQNQVKLDPMGEIQRLASQLYGNPQAVGNAVNYVLGAVQDLGGRPESLGELLAQLQKRGAHLRDGQGPGDLSSLQRLAALYWDQNKGR